MNRGEAENCPKLHFFWGEIVKIALFGKITQKFANLGVKIEKNRVKSIKICTFRVKSFPKLLFFPPLLLFGRIFTYEKKKDGIEN